MHMPVPRRELAPGLSNSRVLTGLWHVADMEKDGATLDPERAARAMSPFVDAGLTTFDMADHYGSAEEIAGVFRTTAKSGKNAQFLTKWVPKPGPVTLETVRAAVRRSLRRLRGPHIDLLQFHAWNYADPRWLDCLFFLRELQREGLIRHLGLTNFDTAHLRIVLESGIEVVSNQVCFSLIDQRPAGAMSELCLKYGVKLLAYGTVAGGFLDGRWLGQSEPSLEEIGAWSRMKYIRFIHAAGGWDRFQTVLASVDRVARRLGVSIANLACRFILDQPAVGGIIVGARLGEREHIEDNLRLFRFSLDDASRSEIASALARLRPIPGDSGDEYRKPPFLTASGDLSHHFREMPPPYESRIGADHRQRAYSGTPWESLAGYCRAVRVGDRISVSGTTATHGDVVIGGDDPVAQTHFVIDKIEGALQSLGGKLEDVIRTRIYIDRMEDWELVSRAHGERFGPIMPANTLVQAKLIGDAYRVEIEAEAIVGNAPQ